MIRRTVKGLVQTLAAFGAGLAISVLAVAWVLSRGPISLGFVTPHINALINDALPSVEAEFDDTILTWAGWERKVDIRVINLRVRADDQAAVIQVPEVAFSISTWALLNGVVAPASIELFGPTLHVARETDGRVNLALAGAGALATGQLEPLLTRLSQPPSPTDPFSYLHRITVTDADLIIEGTGAGRSWVTPDTQLSLLRDGNRVDGEMSFLLDLGDSVAEISMAGTYDGETRRIDAGISFGQMMPSVLAEVAEEANFLRFIEFPVQGTVTIAASVEGELESIGFDLQGEAGPIRLPAPFSGTLQARDLTFNGYYDAVVSRLEVAELNARLQPGEHIAVPAPFSKTYPVSQLRFNGAYDAPQGRLEVGALDLQLSDRISVSLSGLIDDLTVDPMVSLEVKIPSMRAAEIPDYWPESILDDARAWVVSSVLAGEARDFHVAFEGAVHETGVDVSRMDGGFGIHDARINYVGAMPDVTGGNGTVTFNRDRLDVDIASGTSSGMDIQGGRVSLIGLAGNKERAEIRATVSGPFRSAMALIDREPLGFAHKIGMAPDDVSGTIEADLTFDFALTHDLDWGGVNASALASGQDISIPGGLFGLDITNGTLDMAVDHAGMDVTGEMLLENFPTVITWRQNFTSDTAFKNYYTLASHVTDVQNISDLGIDISPFSADMIRGEVPLNVEVTEAHDGTSKLDAVAELDGVSLSAPAINWYKDSGAPGQAVVRIEIENNAVAAIPEFVVQTDDLVVAGSAHYSDTSGKLDRIELSRVKHGRTDMSGLLVPGVAAGTWDADFKGTELDLSPVWEDIIYGDLLGSGKSILENISVSAQFDRVWLSYDLFLDQLTGAFVRADELWRTIYITTRVENGSPLEIKLTPSETGAGRILTAWSGDAGAVFRTLGIYDPMVGGDLTLTGRFDDALPHHPLRGVLEVGTYRITDAPALAQMVSLMALTGILESMQGDGLAFSQLILPFEYAEGVLAVSDAKASGPSLGFTAEGKVYTHANAIDVSGTVVPIYALNSMLGNIPLIGSIFSGGEEGGGLFAAGYTMTGSLEDPEVSVNPLSMLAPGFLRNIFDIFEGAGDPTTADRDDDGFSKKKE